MYERLINNKMTRRDFGKLILTAGARCVVPWLEEREKPKDTVPLIMTSFEPFSIRKDSGINSSDDVLEALFMQGVPWDFSLRRLPVNYKNPEAVGEILHHIKDQFPNGCVIMMLGESLGLWWERHAAKWNVISKISYSYSENLPTWRLPHDIFHWVDRSVPEFGQYVSENDEMWYVPHSSWEKESGDGGVCEKTLTGMYTFAFDHPGYLCSFIHVPAFPKGFPVPQITLQTVRHVTESLQRYWWHHRQHDRPFVIKSPA